MYVPGMKKVTMNDVAQLAGCSKSTVSLVLSRNRPISEATRRKVFDAMEQLGYHPSCSGLRSHCRFIAVLADNCDTPYTQTVLHSLQQEVARHEFLVQFHIVSKGFHEARQVLASLGRDSRIVGIINLLPYLTSVDTMKYCARKPVVIYARENSMLSGVSFDFKQSMQLAFHHLYGLGHRRIAFCCQPYQKNADEVTCSRIQSYRKGMEESGIDGNLLLRICSGNLRQDTPRFQELRENGMTAVIAGTIYIAAAFLQWCGRNAISVPRELSLIAFDDSPLAALLSPPVTTVQTPLRTLTEFAVTDLLDRIAGRDHITHCILPSTLQIRSSTAPVPESGKKRSRNY